MAWHATCSRAEAPLGWLYVKLENDVCTNEATTTPEPVGVDTQVMFVNTYTFNGTACTASIFESVPNGTGGHMRSFKVNVPYNGGVVVAAKENAVFVVIVNNSCVRLVRAAADPSRFLIKNRVETRRSRS